MRVFEVIKSSRLYQARVFLGDPDNFQHVATVDLSYEIDRECFQWILEVTHEGTCPLNSSIVAEQRGQA